MSSRQGETICFGPAISAAVRDILGGDQKVTSVCCRAVLGYTVARTETIVTHSLTHSLTGYIRCGGAGTTPARWWLGGGGAAVHKWLGGGAALARGVRTRRWDAHGLDWLLH